MPDTLRNQLLIPKSGMRFSFRSKKGNSWEIYIISADGVSVYYQYMHNDARKEVALDQWQNMVSDPHTMVEISELRR
jgi:hypothetical protein